MKKATKKTAAKKTATKVAAPGRVAKSHKFDDVPYRWSRLMNALQREHGAGVDDVCVDYGNRTATFTVPA